MEQKLICIKCGSSDFNFYVLNDEFDFGATCNSCLSKVKITFITENVVWFDSNGNIINLKK